MTTVDGVPMSHSETAYTGEMKLFILSQPIQRYLSSISVKNVLNETELELASEVPVNIPISPGTTARLGICFVFTEYKRVQEDDSGVFVLFDCFFNNRQTLKVGAAVDGNPGYSFADRDFERIITIND